VHANEQRDIHRFLSAGEWFGGLPATLQQLILSRSVVRKFAKGQVISIEDSVPKGLYAVLEGEVHLVREVGAGDEALLHVGEPGYWWGDFGVLTGRPTVVTALAHTPVRVLFLSKAQFDRIVAEDPHRYQAFAGLLFDKYAALVRVFAELRELAPESRLRGRLAAMARLRKQERPDQAPVSLAVSQENLARMVGISRQTLNTLLVRLRREGLIEVSYRHVRVLDAARLADPRTEIDADQQAGKFVRRRAAGAASRARGERVE
jgi:CRP-like cAMP-binding protein